MSTTRKSQSSGPRSRTKTTTQKEIDRIKRLEAQTVVNPIFVEAIEYSNNDEFWRSKLLSASRGKFPPNFFMRKNSICFKSPKNEIIREDLGDNPEDIYKIFTRFLRKYGRLDSDIDIQTDENLSKISCSKKRIQRGVSDIELYEHLAAYKISQPLSNTSLKSYQRCIFTLVRLQGKKCIRYDDNNQIKTFVGISYDEETTLYSIDSKILNNVLTKKIPEKVDILSKDEPILYSYYKSKEEDFENVINDLIKNSRNLDLNDVLDMRNIDT